MKTSFYKKAISLLLFLSSVTFYCQAQTSFVWGKQFGTTRDEYSLNHVADKKGNIYLSGKTVGNLDGINRGKNDGFISKVDSSGNIIWSKQFGTDGDEDIQWSAIDNAGSTYITGSTTGILNDKNFGREDILVVKYNTDGQLVWSKQFGTDSIDVGKGIYVDNKGFVYVTGMTTGKLGKSSYGKSDGFIMKLDNNGNQLFTFQFGTTGDDFSNAITEGNNSIYVCGTTRGDLASTNQGFTDVFTVQVTKDGALVKFNQFGSKLFDIAMDLKVDMQNNIYVGGSTIGNLGCQQIGEGDCFLTKLNEKGDIVWTSQFGTQKHDGIRSIVLDDPIAGKILVSGLLSLPPVEAFIRMYGNDGSILWEKNIIDDHINCEASGKDVSIDDKGYIYHLGLTPSNLFGRLIGDHDLYLVKFKLTGDYLK